MHQHLSSEHTNSTLLKGFSFQFAASETVFPDVLYFSQLFLLSFPHPLLILLRNYTELPLYSRLAPTSTRFCQNFMDHSYQVQFCKMLLLSKHSTLQIPLTASLLPAHSAYRIIYISIILVLKP